MITVESSPCGITSTALGLIPARSSTSRSGTPRHCATPIAPSFQAEPVAGVPCWLAKKLRPLPAHSMNAARVSEGMPRRSRRLSEIPFGSLRPLPNRLSRQLVGSTSSVAVWLRTKNFSAGVR